MSTYVYRLIVTLPPGSEDPWRTGWEPEGWTYEPSGDPAESIYFRWPTNHLYLSRSGAERRAGLFRQFGAEVAIERSCPVFWPIFRDTVESAGGVSTYV